MDQDNIKKFVNPYSVLAVILMVFVNLAMLAK